MFFLFLCGSRTPVTVFIRIRSPEAGNREDSGIKKRYPVHGRGDCEVLVLPKGKSFDELAQRLEFRLQNLKVAFKM